MSFYGNISNAGKTQLTFDKVYPNRYTMEANAAIDGVFSGRYVLVEYDDNTYSRRSGYMKSEPFGQFNVVYSDSDCTLAYRLTPATVKDGYGLKAGDLIVVKLNKILYYLQCTGKSEASTGHAYFNLVLSSTSKGEEIDDASISDYMVNYEMDKRYAASCNYPFTAGWDSTIWQKVYTNGSEHYQMIASLNSITPSFTVAYEAPTLEPIPPHFGENSTNIDYSLHVQPTWGLRVKEAENEELSDAEVSSSLVGYNTETKTDEIVDKTYKGAIYYNQAGFDKNYISHSDEKNEISILPTGVSGRKYVTHNGAGDGAYLEEARPDIQEIKIHLPEIGNVMSEVWDLVYGNLELNDNNKEKKRNTDIQWNSTAGLRMVQEDPYGSGFLYTSDDAATIAGCINSVHDLMGMIISEAPATGQTKEEALNMAQGGRIYYGALGDTSKKGYFYKTKGYDYISFEDKMAGDPSFNPESYVGSRKYYNLTQFSPNKYHTYVDGDFYMERAELPTEDTQYYLLGEPIQTKLIQWQPVVDEETGEIEYSYYENNEDYIKDVNQYASDNRTYYAITATAATILNPKPNQKVTKIWNPVDLKDITNTVTASELILPSELADNEVDAFYSGYFYLELDGDGKPQSLKAVQSGDAFSLSRKYYYVPICAATKGQDATGTLNPTLYFIQEQRLISFTKALADDSIYQQYEIVFLPFDGVRYYSKYEVSEDQPIEGYKYLRNQADIDDEVVYYILKLEAKTGDLPDEEHPESTIYTDYYKPGRYFFHTVENDMILATSEEFDPSADYYILTDKNGNIVRQDLSTNLFLIEPEDITFYLPGEYYYRSIQFGQDILDNNYTMKTPEDTDVDSSYVYNNMVYYIPQKAYVINDTAGVLAKGCVWDKNTDPPQSITLGLREEKYQWTELKGFARTLNTIHGLILQLNQFFSFDDELTRDDDTVQGCLNLIKDILDTFDVLNPGEVVVVDEYGRLTGAYYTTDNWIDVTVHDDLRNSTIDVVHADAQAVASTKGESTGGTLQFGGSFNAVHFSIDAKGHVIGNTFKDTGVTLPSLSVDSNGTGNIVTGLSVSSDGQQIVASKANIGSLAITGYTVGTESKALSATDTLNSALGSLEYKLNILNAGSTQEGSVAYQIAQIVNEDNNDKIDKLNEIAAWIVSDTTGAAKMNADIITNAQNIAANKLLIEANVAAIEANEANIAKNTAAIATLSENVSAEKIAQWDVAEANVQSDWAETNIEADSFIKNKPDLENLVKTTSQFDYVYNGTTTQLTIEGLLEHIAALEARIYALENPS